MNKYVTLKCKILTYILSGFLTTILNIQNNVQCLSNYKTKSFDFVTLNNTLIRAEVESDYSWKTQQSKDDNKSEKRIDHDNKCHAICSGNFCIPETYNHFVLPTNESTNEVLNVRIDFDIIDFLEINDKDFSVTFSTYLGVYWEDPRLTQHSGENGDDGFLTLDTSILSCMWVPDIYMYNLKSIEVLSVMMRRFEGLWIVNGTLIRYGQEAQMTFSCPMRFGFYPLDTQVSFQIHPKVVPGRMSLLILLFLVLINIQTEVTSMSPNVEGLSAISGWLIICILFVFGALIEYAVILYKLRRQEKRNSAGKCKKASPNGKWASHAKKMPEMQPQLDITSYDFMESVDQKCAIAFPIMFILFNIIYWLAMVAHKTGYY